MAILNNRVAALAIMLIAFFGSWLTPQRCDAQAGFFYAPYYEVQIRYKITGQYPYPVFRWITVLETDDYKEAEFIYALYLLAKEQGILDEVAPDYDPPYTYINYTAVNVRMLTLYPPFGDWELAPAGTLSP